MNKFIKNYINRSFYKKGSFDASVNFVKTFNLSSAKLLYYVCIIFSSFHDISFIRIDLFLEFIISDNKSF